MLSRIYSRWVPRLVEGRGWLPSFEPLWCESSVPILHGLAFLHSWMNFESRLHRVRGGSVGM